MDIETKKHNLDLLYYRGYCLIGINWTDELVKFIKDNSDLKIDIIKENKMFNKIQVIKY